MGLGGALLHVTLVPDLRQAQAAARTTTGARRA